MLPARPLLPSLSVAAVVLVTSASALAAEPWIDPDPEHPPERHAIGDFGIAADAEYRAQFIFVNPIALSAEENQRYNLMEHRGRFGVTVDYDEMIKLTTSLDLLDGVLWGDNGTFGSTPSSEAGLQVTTRNPNVVKPCVGVIEGGDPLDASGYGYSLCDASALYVRRLYAQVRTPIGALRIGRQPVTIGMGVQTAGGDGRRNRFGPAYRGDQVDRIMFATKPLEAFKAKEDRNSSEHEGLITAVMYDRWATDSTQIFGDDIHQMATAVRYLEPDFVIGSDLELTVFWAHRWDHQYLTRVNTVGGRLSARFGDFHIGIDNAANIGTTQEVSSAYAVITADPVVDQDILQYGGRFVARYDQPMWTAYFEVDYASGDGDPQARTPLSQFRFAEDTNVGLLMFDHVVRHQSVLASAAAVEITRRLGAVSFPAERVHTRGAFTNAFAIFPQFDFRPHETILFRAGVLVAWAPELLVDPVASLQARDGVTIDDDLVNFVGGKPGKFYGAEIDARFRWRFLEHFAFDLEGAVMFPGDALEDVNGQAVKSFLTQARSTVFF